MSAPQGGLIGFKEIAFKGKWRMLFIGLPVAIVALVVVCIFLYSLNAPTIEGTSAAGGPDITISEYTGDVILHISYTFQLSRGSGGGWVVSDGINQTVYSFQFENKKGGIAASGNGDFRIHSFFDDEDGDSTNDYAKHTESKTFILNVPKGDYHLNVTSNTIVDIELLQITALDEPIYASTWLGVLLIIVLSGATITVMDRRDRENVRRLKETYPEMFPSPAGPAMGAVPSGQYATVPTAGGYVTQPVTGGGYQQPGPTSSLEYVPGNYVVENYCMNCGGLMQGLVTDGVLVCEHCGTQNRK